VDQVPAFPDGARLPNQSKPLHTFYPRNCPNAERPLHWSAARQSFAARTRALATNQVGRTFTATCLAGMAIVDALEQEAARGI